MYLIRISLSYQKLPCEWGIGQSLVLRQLNRTSIVRQRIWLRAWPIGFLKDGELRQKRIWINTRSPLQVWLDYYSLSFGCGMTQTDPNLAVAFGRGLQAVNIIRNRNEDLSRGVDFFPDGWKLKEMFLYARRNLVLQLYL